MRENSSLHASKSFQVVLSRVFFAKSSWLPDVKLSKLALISISPSTDCALPRLSFVVLVHLRLKHAAGPHQRRDACTSKAGSEKKREKRKIEFESRVFLKSLLIVNFNSDCLKRSAIVVLVQVASISIPFYLFLPYFSTNFFFFEKLGNSTSQPRFPT